MLNENMLNFMLDKTRQSKTRRLREYAGISWNRLAIRHSNTDTIETKTINGLTCIWKGTLIDNNKSIKYSWQFNWDEVVEDVKGFTGHVQVRRIGMKPIETTRFDVKLTKQNQIIEKVVENTNQSSNILVVFDSYFTSFKKKTAFYDLDEQICLEEMFRPSEKTDAILLVDGKKLHVNKAFLSFHSDYFTALFSSNYKEGQMDEIPIKDVSFEDFGLLLSVIYPASVFPTDKTVEKLLELADRFLIPEVFHHAEHHLLHISAIQHEKKILLADKYTMKKLLEKSIKEIRNIEDGKKLKQAAVYNQLSNDTKVMILDKILT
ncbi:hypothetical protein CRE_21294 [Caenorhabditis remanei]|uniref:BTB domain-containing protein n=1 Tax=Caenorhabditis remanei TaxID=31234 RepID=E3MUJ8_CAERE|nr:hypothetical protein CRE_21294 [Caenorhabditis remanei]